MISEIVLFHLPEGMSRADAMAKYRARVPMWQANPDLIHKAFLFDEESRRVVEFTSGRTLRPRKKRTAPLLKVQSSLSLAPNLSFSISKHPS